MFSVDRSYTDRLILNDEWLIIANGTELKFIKNGIEVMILTAIPENTSINLASKKQIVND